MKHLILLTLTVLIAGCNDPDQKLLDQGKAINSDVQAVSQSVQTTEDEAETFLAAGVGLSDIQLTSLQNAWQQHRNNLDEKEAELEGYIASIDSNSTTLLEQVDAIQQSVATAEADLLALQQMIDEQQQALQATLLAISNYQTLISQFQQSENNVVLTAGPQGEVGPQGPTGSAGIKGDTGIGYSTNEINTLILDAEAFAAEAFDPEPEATYADNQRELDKQQLLLEKMINLLESIEVAK